MKGKSTKILDVRTLIYCSLLIATFTGIMSIINMIIGDTTLIIITGLATIWFLLNVIICFIFKNKIQLVFAMMFGVYTLMMYNVICGGADGFSIVWLLVIPPAVQYCLNSNYGVFFNLVVGFSLIIYLWTPLYNIGNRILLESDCLSFISSSHSCVKLYKLD